MRQAVDTLMPGPMHRAGWFAADMLHGGRTLLGAALTRDDPDAYSTSGRGAPIVVLPGVFETWYFMKPIADRLAECGRPVHVVSELGHNRLTIPESAEVVARSLAARGLEKVSIVAHSKGGLIAKQLMVAQPELVDKCVTICTPFSGSRYARWAPIPELKIFAAGDPVTAELARNLAANARITSVSAAFDPLIPEGSHLEGATNVRLSTAGHFRVLASRELWRVVAEALEIDTTGCGRGDLNPHA